MCGIDFVLFRFGFVYPLAVEQNEMSFFLGRIMFKK